ncbi:hypothetical protein [Lacticaseibacillus jixiensis]|uniref:hypothetical protein n=1 Tax=Lacticaseibacillus jixiensis TaxID=3231926 RepID=UPI0036F438B8
MHKSLGIGAIALIGLLLAACSSNNDSASSKDAATISSLKQDNASLQHQIKAASGESSSTKHVTLAKVGVAQYTITGIRTEKVTNKEANYTNAEYNFDDIANFPKQYYRTTIGYQLKNVGTKPFGLGYMQAHVVDATGVEFTDSGTDTFGFNENSNGDVQPGTATTGKFILLSTTAPKLNTFKISVSEQRNDTEIFGPAGITQYK